MFKVAEHLVQFCVLQKPEMSLCTVFVFCCVFLCFAFLHAPETSLCTGLNSSSLGVISGLSPTPLMVMMIRATMIIVMMLKLMIIVTMKISATLNVWSRGWKQRHWSVYRLALHILKYFNVIFRCICGLDQTTNLHDNIPHHVGGVLRLALRDGDGEYLGLGGGHLHGPQGGLHGPHGAHPRRAGRRVPASRLRDLA